MKTYKSVWVGLVMLLTLASARAGIVHRWSFSEGTGTNIADSVGTANGSIMVIGGNVDYTWTNSVLRLAGGARATADYIQFPSNLLHSAGVSNNVTIEIWAKPVSFQNWSRIFDFGSGAGTAGTFFLSFSVGTDGGRQRYEYNNPVSWTVDTTNATTAGTQYHYVATWAPTGGTNGGGNAQWYRNGVLMGSRDTGTNTITNVNDTVLWLGRSAYATDLTANAEYDEVRMWNVVLTAAQIGAEFTNGPNNPGQFGPIAVNDSATVIVGGQVLVNELQNDTPVQAPIDTNSVVIVTPPTNGTAIVQVGGSIRYTHNGGGSTTDTFTYRVSDTMAATSQVATVTMTITPLPGALVHRYNFNNTNANDSAGTAHGTTNGGTSFNNTSVVLNGSNGFVNLPNGIISSLTNVTIEAWFTETASNVWGRIFDFGNNTAGEDAQGTGTSYIFLTPVSSGGNLRFAYTTNSNGAENPVLNGPVISSNTAYYVAVVYNPSANFSALYVNGAQVTNGTATGPLSALSDVNNWLGKSQWSNDLYFKGSIDEFRIWNGQLGAAQIASDYTNGPNNVVVLPPVAVNDSAALATGGSVLINVLQNDVGQGTTLDTNSVQILSSPTNGTAQLQLGGSILYTHNGGPSTADSFTYRVADTLGTFTQPATVVLNIANIPPGLVHRYNFTIDANDQAGSANGTLVNGATITNGSLMLDGANDFLNLPNGIISSLTNITIETWVTRTVANTWARIFDFGSSTGGEDAQGNGVTYIFLTSPANNAGGPLRFAYSINGGGAAENPILNGPVLSNGTPYYIALVYNPANNVSALYVNGAVVATNTATGALSALADINNWLGRSQYNDPYFNGSIDEFRIWNVPFSATQIATNNANGPNSLVMLPPVANGDSVTLNPGALALINVLQNDLGQGSALNPASVTIVTPPAAGTAQVKPDGKILYTHGGGPGVSDSFTYRVSDMGGQTSGVATVSVTVSSNLRLLNTTMTVPNTAPTTAYQIVDAYPGIVVTNPLALRTPPNNSNMLFVVERNGVISYLTNVSSPTPTRQIFMNIGNQITYNAGGQGELGLLSMAFHPNFASNGYFYVTYTAPGGSTGLLEKLARFQANPTNFAMVDTNTQQILFFCTKRDGNHNGGDLHFGNDGFLYVSMGDEGDQLNANTNAQRLDLALWAGILRLDVDKKTNSFEPSLPRPGIQTTLTIPTNGSGAFYSIPSDNPFIGQTTNVDGTAINTNYLRTEFYAIGMRHPWRFSIDKPTGNIWVGIVGQYRIEEVNILRKGGNYGWPYYEGPSNALAEYPGSPGLQNPPPGFQRDGPLWWYLHNGIASSDPLLNDPAFQGLDVNGSLFYRGTKIPQLTNAYLFGDFDTGGNIWALRQPSSNVVTVERLTGLPGISAFGADPINGDCLLCNYLNNKIQRLIYTDVSSAFPQKLSDTGVFADLASLTPNPGIVSYQPNIAFWSDYAIKTRWFTIPDLVSTVDYTQDSNWTLPMGTKWIKHFDLELERGNPATKRRIETRILTKTSNSVYGVSYKWTNTQDEAYLVPDAGDLFQLTVTNAGVPFQQDWEIPSRSSCLSCHTPVGGFALTFNTREMNKDFSMNGFAGNQLTTMSAAGYFSSSVPNPHTLPAFAPAGDTNYSLEYRVRSYLAVNCVQCHQPGGAGQASWDARPYLTLAQTGLINGTAVANDGGNPANKIIVPGDTNHSVLLMRLENTNGFSRMPPLATHQLDFGSIQLVQNWISLALPNQPSYAQWIALYPSLSGPSADPNADPDGDGANNYFEYLTGTDPTSAGSKWVLSLAVGGGQSQVSYPQVPNLGVVIETSSDLVNWVPWDVAGNSPFFASYPGTRTVSGAVLPPPADQFFRARLLQP